MNSYEVDLTDKKILPPSLREKHELTEDDYEQARKYCIEILGILKTARELEQYLYTSAGGFCMSVNGGILGYDLNILIDYEGNITREHKAGVYFFSDGSRVELRYENGRHIAAFFDDYEGD
jgi:hypothetical protein